MTPRLFQQILSMQLRRSMAYRGDFLILMTSGLLSGVVIPYFLWGAIFEESGQSTIGGFTPASMLLYYVLAAFTGRLVRGAEFDGTISEDVYQGRLTKYLIIPSAYFPFKYAQHLGGTAPALVQLLLFGSIFAVVLDLPPEVHFTPASLVMATISLLLANLLHYLLVFPIHCVAFWADNVWSLIVLMRFITALLGGIMVPLALFPESIRSIVMLTPFPQLYHTPVTAAMGALPPGEWAVQVLLQLLWITVFGLVGHWVFRRGTQQYAGVGI